MLEQSRINGAYARAARMDINRDTRLVLISDCHRGTGNGNDNFAKNQKLLHHALSTYYADGFICIELGDGDELWENRSIEMIKCEYAHLFELLSIMYRDGKYIMLYGNHDRVKENVKWVRKKLSDYRVDQCSLRSPLFPDIEVLESILLCEKDTDTELLLLHGHQADFFNDRLGNISRWLVRYLWGPLELIGVTDPMRSSVNPKKKDKVEKILMQWCGKNKKGIIAGHTHRPVYPKPGEIPYFNDGSCVHPRYITALEIVGHEISLVKWEVTVKDDGVLGVNKKVLYGPNRITSYCVSTTV